ncbi:hypothetical protein P9112_006742 [Eukaryota sp. TZLM1-RC]
MLPINDHIQPVVQLKELPSQNLHGFASHNVLSVFFQKKLIFADTSAEPALLAKVKSIKGAIAETFLVPLSDVSYLCIVSTPAKKIHVLRAQVCDQDPSEAPPTVAPLHTICTALLSDDVPRVCCSTLPEQDECHLYITSSSFIYSISLSTSIPSTEIYTLSTEDPHHSFASPITSLTAILSTRNQEHLIAVAVEKELVLLSEGSTSKAMQVVTHHSFEQPITSLFFHNDELVSVCTSTTLHVLALTPSSFIPMSTMVLPEVEQGRWMTRASSSSKFILAFNGGLLYLFELEGHLLKESYKFQNEGGVVIPSSPVFCSHDREHSWLVCTSQEQQVFLSVQAIKDDAEVEVSEMPEQVSQSQTEEGAKEVDSQKVVVESQEECQKEEENVEVVQEEIVDIPQPQEQPVEVAPQEENMVQESSQVNPNFEPVEEPKKEVAAAVIEKLSQEISQIPDRVAESQTEPLEKESVTEDFQRRHAELVEEIESLKVSNERLLDENHSMTRKLAEKGPQISQQPINVDLIVAAVSEGLEARVQSIVTSSVNQSLQSITPSLNQSIEQVEKANASLQNSVGHVLNKIKATSTQIGNKLATCQNQFKEELLSAVSKFESQLNHKMANFAKQFNEVHKDSMAGVFSSSIVPAINETLNETLGPLCAMISQLKTKLRQEVSGSHDDLSVQIGALVSEVSNVQKELAKVSKNIQSQGKTQSNLDASINDLSLQIQNISRKLSQVGNISDPATIFANEQLMLISNGKIEDAFINLLSNSDVSFIGRAFEHMCCNIPKPFTIVKKLNVDFISRLLLLLNIVLKYADDTSPLLRFASAVVLRATAEDDLSGELGKNLVDLSESISGMQQSKERDELLSVFGVCGLSSCY